MGYRSDFKLVASGARENIDLLVLYMQEQAAQPDFLNEKFDGYGWSRWFMDFCQSSQILKEEGRAEQALLVTIQSAKCYGQFDEVVQAIVEKAEGLKLDTAWAIMGEDSTDFKEYSSGNSFIPYMRELGDPAW